MAESPGKRRPTMADVARRVGVSRALVSLVFRNQPGPAEETRRRVLRAADEPGYRPDSAARLLAPGRSRTLGVMLTLHQLFETDIVEAVLDPKLVVRGTSSAPPDGRQARPGAYVREEIVPRGGGPRGDPPPGDGTRARRVSRRAARWRPAAR